MSEDQIEKDENQVLVTQEIGGKFHQAEFLERADPIKLQLFKCPNDGHMHFRHAGYVMPMLPFVEKNEPKVQVTALQVMLCIKCKSAYVFIDNKLHDVTDQVDLKAWEKTEKQAHKETGPGGQC